MIQIKGNKQIEITKNDLLDYSKGYNEVIIDLGTGDGRFVYKNARKNEEKFYIGIDPSAKQLEIYSKKSRKEKLHNAIFLIGSLEIFPINIIEFADKIYITLPWGSLLKEIIQPNKTTVRKISELLKKDGNLEIIFGYSQNLEPSETTRLDLPQIDQTLIDTLIVPKLQEYGKLHLQQQKTLTKEDLYNFESTWSKKLSFGSERPLFQLILKKC